MSVPLKAIFFLIYKTGLWFGKLDEVEYQVVAPPTFFLRDAERLVRFPSVLVHEKWNLVIELGTALGTEPLMNGVIRAKFFCR